MLGEQTARKRADADRKDEGALVDGDGAAARLGRGDVGEHDLAGGDDQPGAGAGDEAGQR